MLKKILIVTGSLIIVLLLANIGLSYWVAKKLPSIIQDQKDFPYNISYKDLDIEVFSGSFTVTEAYLAPKDTTGGQLKEGAFGKIGSLKVTGVGYWDLLFNDEINVNRVLLIKPDITVYKAKKKYSPKKDVDPLKNTIHTSSLEIREGTFKMLDSTQNFVMKAANISFELNNITLDSSTVKENVPIRYRDYKLKCDSLFYQAGKDYVIDVGRLDTTDSTLVIENFKLTPTMTRLEFARSIPKEKDQFRVKAPKIEIPHADWGFLNDTLFIHSPEVVLNKVQAVIYRPKMPADDNSHKKLYSQMLRELNFDLKVDKLLLKDSYIQYEEQQEYGREAAKVTFSDFYCTLYNMYSPVNKKDIPVTKADVQCLFMKKAPLKVTWSFNIMDTSDAFTINGDIANLKSEWLNPVSEPLMNISTNGAFDHILFTMNGNKERAAGVFNVKYDNLKVVVLQKDGKDKNKFMSFVGNLIAKNDTKGELKKTDVEVDRVKSKSAFNFLWRFLQQGLKQTILPDI